MKNKKVLIAIIAIVVILALLLTIYFVSTMKKEGDKDVTMVVVIDGKTENYALRTQDGYVIDVLDRLQQSKKLTFSSENGYYGEYITSINGRVADEEKNEYYALYINGEYASYGVTTQTINDGDEIKLVLEKW